MKKPVQIAPAKGKLGVLLPGMGAVATTFIAGVMLARRGHAHPTGSLTQLGRIRLGKRTERRTPLIREVVPLASLDDLVFGGWDVLPHDAYTTARTAEVLDASDLEKVRNELAQVRPMPGVFFPGF